MSIAETILQQLGGNRFIAMTGAKNFLSDGNTLRMTLPKNGSKANRLWVTYNSALDLYDMRFFRYRPGRIDIRTGKFIEDKISDEKIFNGICCDQLQELFTEHTKMYTHL